MFHVPLHRKIAAAGAPTLDDVRDNPSSYSWTGPTYSRLVLFSNNGNDFDGVSLSLTLNGCSYKTGTGGGLEQPGGGSPAESSPAVEFYGTSNNASLIVFYTLGADWANFQELIDYQNRHDYLRAGSTDQLRLLGANGSGHSNIVCAACRHVLGAMYSVGFTYDQTLGVADRTRGFLNGSFYSLGTGASVPQPWYFQDFGGDTGGTAGPASVINMIIGFESTLSDQNMIDIMSDPASFFS